MVGHSSNLTLLFSIIVFLAIAGVIVPFLKRIGVSTIIGYLICGLIIGPYGIGSLADQISFLESSIIRDIHAVRRLGEFGVIFLMFMIGLKLSFKQLFHLKHLVLGLGVSQIMITSVIIIFIATLFGNSIQTSILVGMSLALSSTAVVMHILSEKHLINTPVGNISFSVLLMQDLAVIPMLVILGAFASGDSQSTSFIILESLFLTIVVVLFIILFSKLLLRPVLNYLSVANNPEWLTAIALFLVILISTITEVVGLSTALGAFLAGLLISETEYKHEIEVIIEPLKGILLGVFFLSIGMSININAVYDTPLWLAASVFGIFILKFMVLFPLGMIFKISTKQSIKMAILLSGCGEFTFLILSIAIFHNMLPQQDAQFFLLVTAFSMMLTPITVRLVKPIDKLINKFGKRIDHDDPEDQVAEIKHHVIIAGFSKEEEIIGRILEKQLIPFIAIDKDAKRTQKLRTEGYNILYGNAKRIELWRKLNAKNANIAIINIEKIDEANKIISIVKKEYPHLFIIAKTSNTANIELLYNNGADQVISEALESNLKVADLLLEKVGMDKKEITDYLTQKRKLAILDHS